MDEKNKSESPEQHPAAAYETQDANFKNIMFAGAGIVGLIVLTLALTWAISAFLIRHSANPGSPAREMTTSAPVFPAPQLQENPILELQRLRAREDSVLTTYGWTDRNAGLVRVPIDQAMSLLLSKGLPVESSEAQLPRDSGYADRPGRNLR
jgi:hypothetical protein